MIVRRRPVPDRQGRSPATLDPAVRAKPRAPSSGPRPWLYAGGLALLGLVPVLARLLAELAGGGGGNAAADVTVAASIVLTTHAAAGAVFSVLGAFQFPTALRRGRRGVAWHPWVGRFLVPIGLIAAVSALWLTLFYSRAGPLLFVFRLVAGVAMVSCIVTGYLAIRRRAVHRHRAWMIRGYAIGLAAGTQVFTLGFGGAVFGTGEFSTAMLTGAGWVINLAVAEWVIRRPRRIPATIRDRSSAPMTAA